MFLHCQDDRRGDIPVECTATGPGASSPRASMADGKAPARAYRIGIDVGGTFTKAVLIDNATHAVVGRYSVLTTHSHARGVAGGVVEVFRNVLGAVGRRARGSRLPRPQHDAGDQRAAGGRRGSCGRARHGRQDGRGGWPKARCRVAPIELAPGRSIATANRFPRHGQHERGRCAGGRSPSSWRRAHRFWSRPAPLAWTTRASEELARRIGAEAGLAHHLRARDHTPLRADHAYAHGRHQRLDPAAR